MSVTMIAKALWTPLPQKLWAKSRGGREFRVTASSAKSTLIAIADSADDFGENSYNSIATLALKTSLEERSMPRILRALEQNGYCINKGVSRYGTSNYSLNVSKLGTPPSKRPKTGRPKSTDSQRESTDSERESTDSQRESTDSESPDPSLSVLEPSLTPQAGWVDFAEPGWAFGHGQTPLTVLDEEAQFQALAKDSANLIATGKPSLYALAMAFIEGTGLIPTDKQVKEWRKQMCEWLLFKPNQPRQAHVFLAISEMKKKNLTIARPSSLFNLQQIANDRQERETEDPTKLASLREKAKQELIK